MAFVQFLLWIFWYVRALFKDRIELATENLAYRQQLAAYQREGKRPRIERLDRVLWATLSRWWTNWRHAIAFVEPATVIGWHRMGWRLFWRWKSKPGRGRPPIAQEIRDLIRQMSRENQTWGSPRIVSELAQLGHKVCEDTVLKYMVRGPKPPSQRWSTFLANHMADTVACDFFTVPTATFRVLYVMVILAHDRRRVVGFNVTEHPTAEWAAQQIVQAFPDDTAPRFLLRDNDGAYGQAFQDRMESLGIEEVKTAPRSPWQNPYCERLIGSIRRECLDHVIVLGERHLTWILKRYFDYYHTARCHLSLDRPKLS